MLNKVLSMFLSTKTNTHIHLHQTFTHIRCEVTKLCKFLLLKFLLPAEAFNLLGVGFFYGCKMRKTVQKKNVLIIFIINESHDYQHFMAMTP